MAFWNKNKSSSEGILSGKELRNLLNEREKERKGKERKLEKENHFGTHPLWHVVLFIGLVVIFFPWSLLLLLLLFGWDGSVQIFRGLVIGTIGLFAFLLWSAILLAIVLVIVVAVIG